MKLSEVMQGISCRYAADCADIEITGISYDSRKVEAGHMFICVSGFKTDGHDYALQAVEKGAQAILAEREIEVPPGVVLVIGEDNRKNLARVASNFYGAPSRKLKLIGVTGTNGKTTTTHLIKYMLEAASHKAGIIGTLYASVGDYRRELGNTTPESVDIEDFLALCLGRGADYAVMEVSSHAAELGRVDCLDFDMAVITNLTQDHLDFHGDMETYKKAKIKFFKMLLPLDGRLAVVNLDDEYAEDFIKESPVQVKTYGIVKAADFRASNIRTSLNRTEFSLESPLGSFQISTAMIGTFSVYNALAAIASAVNLGVDMPTIQSVLSAISGVDGRYEQVNCGQDFTVVVDYAHTPDGLENILKTSRGIVQNRLITVFGCGGDRDKTKRPKMGRIAAEYSDLCIVTSDNPRSEDPPAIISDILAGMPGLGNNRIVDIVDRAEAIRHAISIAQTGDMVVIAGKGHETYQLIKGQVLDFDDRKVAARCLSERLENAL